MNAQEISRLISRVPGMSNAANLATLYDCAMKTAHVPGIMVEIGVWCGRSAVVLGKAAQAMGTRLYAYDLFPPFDWWKDKVSVSVLDAQIAPVYRNGGPELLARSAIESAGLESVVKVVKGRSAHVPPIPVRFAFIDGGHDYNSVALDIKNLLPRMSFGGIMVFDDVQNSYPEVYEAISDNLKVYTERLNNKMLACFK